MWLSHKTGCFYFYYIMNVKIMDFRNEKDKKSRTYNSLNTSWLLFTHGFPCVCSAKSCLFCKLGVRRRQTAATATWVAPTPWTRPCCCSTASTTGSPGTSSRSTSRRTSHRLRGCPTTSPCKRSESKSMVSHMILTINSVWWSYWTNAAKVGGGRTKTNPDLQSCVTVFCYDNRHNWEPG